MSNRAILYLRSSKDRSDVSIDAQRRALHDLAVARNLIIVDEFADAVESGKDEDRPAFQHMLHELKTPGRGWEFVLMIDTARCGRRRVNAMLFERECERRGARVVYMNIPDTDPITEMLLKSILQAMDEWHSLTSRQKGLAGMAENVRQGWRAGGKAPRGYKLEYRPTGAIREGQPVLKSVLAIDDETAGAVRAYLKVRATGTSRGAAIAKLQLQWPTSSTHSMDWQALTYAGHTVWNMHAERAGGGTADGLKRRPRSEWMINRGTHPALITDEEAEAILGQQERSLQGRRLRESPLLLTGLLVTPGGAPWHSDGGGRYRVGKGVRVNAARFEQAVLELIARDMSSDAAVARLAADIQKVNDEPVIDGRRLAGLERKIATVTTQIGRTVDLAAGLEDPAPVLRRVQDLERQRAGIVAELAQLRERRATQASAAEIDPAQIRSLLRRAVAEIVANAEDPERRAEARQAVAEVVERAELDPLTLKFRLHYAVRSGDNLASPTSLDLSPSSRWASAEQLFSRRAA